MTKWAVGAASLFDNDLKVEIIEAYEPLGALAKHSVCAGTRWRIELPDGSPSTDEIKQFFFDCEVLVGWERLD